MKVDIGFEGLTKDRFTFIGLQIQKLDRYALHIWFMGVGLTIIF